LEKKLVMSTKRKFGVYIYFYETELFFRRRTELSHRECKGDIYSLYWAKESTLVAFSFVSFKIYVGPNSLFVLSNNSWATPDSEPGSSFIFSTKPHKHTQNRLSCGYEINEEKREIVYK
jgi:hypothetical protein